MSRYVFTSKPHGVDVEVDLDSQVLELEVDDEESFWSVRERLRQRSQEGRVDEVGIRVLDTSSPLEPYLHPTLAGLQRDWEWTPAMVFALKAKAFDDGLYAAVELLVQRGTPALPGKRRLLEQVHQVLLAQWSAGDSDPLRSVLVLLRSALSMTGPLDEGDRKLRLLVMRFLKDFESKEGASKPLGFYTWSPQLEGVFKQDRLLQTELEPDAARTLLAALESDASLYSAWRRHVQLPSRLTNPTSKPALDEDGEQRCFLPPSDSHEGRVVKELFGRVSPPPGFQLVDELIARIRDGRLDTTPATRSGWYDHQFHALVPFLVPERMPEAERLVIGPRYRAELEQQFRALFALTRETHIKQLEQLTAGGVPLIVQPRLTIEPLAEFYRRRAEGYSFLRNVLCEFLGAPALANAQRVTPAGTVEVPLLEELVWMEQVFRGAHAIVRQELGFEEVAEAALPAALLTRRWLLQWKEDPDLARDPRCVVPLFFDLERGKTKVLAVLGFNSTPVKARFLRRPTVHLHGEGAGQDASECVFFSDGRHGTVRPMCAELYVSRVPDREEFQSLCDAHGSPDAILRALEG
ncbi:hypothetical protein [Pyxidicoccus xibeiensis]|uniref:hypothetical protein n=1 Tax=Pyxidicoccus xibeiensis TaxID=2906759 RepID=UPI0020A7282B|nr:hypothetical protein [Pyxidicoccus xibeiensis]MCP3141488.1 hypothetical protein [Pyxidicoccus xibeiensis]